MGSLDFTDNLIFLDGAMGTVLQQRGLPAGGQPELLNLTRPELLEEIHREYIQAGSRIIYANTFGANARKLAPTGHGVEEVVTQAVRICQEGGGGHRYPGGRGHGPSGELLEPMGSLSFEDAYALFREVAVAGAPGPGADLAVIETMTDLYEARAALLAVKENTDLPVFVTLSL